MSARSAIDCAIEWISALRRSMASVAARVEGAKSCCWAREGVPGARALRDWAVEQGEGSRSAFFFLLMISSGKTCRIAAVSRATHRLFVVCQCKERVVRRLGLHLDRSRLVPFQFCEDEDSGFLSSARLFSVLDPNANRLTPQVIGLLLSKSGAQLLDAGRECGLDIGGHDQVDTLQLCLDRISRSVREE